MIPESQCDSLIPTDSQIIEMPWNGCRSLKINTNLIDYYVEIPNTD